MTKDINRLTEKRLFQFELYDELMSTNCYSVRLLCHLNQIAYNSNYAHVNPLKPINIEPELYDHYASKSIKGTLNCMKYLIFQQHLNQWAVSTADEEDTWRKFNLGLSACLGQIRLKHLSLTDISEDDPKLHLNTLKLLQHLDDHLCDQTIKNYDWLSSRIHASVIDIFVFPLVAVSFDAGIKLDSFVHIRRWIRKVHRLKYFEPMPGLLG